MVINRTQIRKSCWEDGKEIFVLFFAKKRRVDYGLHEFGKRIFLVDQIHNSLRVN